MVAGLALANNGVLFAAETLEQRVERMESKLNSPALVEMSNRLDSLQQEVEQLRGAVEEREHQVEQMGQRQRELYLDADRRLSRLEREGDGAMATSPPSSGLVAGPAAAVPLAATPAQGGQPPPAVGTPVATMAAEMGPTPEQLKEEREAYQQAFELLKELRYEASTNAFIDFIKRYPESRYAHIAQYWVGEANYARRKFKDAIKDYRALLANYPTSPKLAEALLKIGYSYSELGNRSEATKALTELTSRYPGTTEAGQAEATLKRLQK